MITNGRARPHMINIAGLDKAVVLKALFDAAKIPGPIFCVDGLTINGRMPIEMAIKEIETSSNQLYPLQWEYLHGRSLKFNLRGAELDPYLYDRDNGRGTAARAIESVWIKQRAEIMEEK